jgi:hypothetical protein
MGDGSVDGLTQPSIVEMATEHKIVVIRMRMSSPLVSAQVLPLAGR